MSRRGHSDPGSPRERYRDESPPPRRRERSRNRDSVQEFVQLSEEDYRTANRNLYPPDGYYNITKRVKDDKGKRRRVTEANQEYPQEWREANVEYHRRQDQANLAHSSYENRRKELRTAEEMAGLTYMYERTGKLAAPNSTEIYLQAAHYELREPAADWEDKAYSYATKRMEEFEKWPRIMRTSESDRRHYQAVERSWEDYEPSKPARDEHDRYSERRRRHS